jgi:hypothetical protein
VQMTRASSRELILHLIQCAAKWQLSGISSRPTATHGLRVRESGLVS